jgi:hypothetical protein
MASNVPPPAAAAHKRGPGYTQVEDLLICKVFIIVSEDSTVGASQKGAAFKSKMHTEYVSLITNQHSYESSLLGTASSAITRDGYAQSGITGLPFHDRSPDSIYSRFKDKISPDVSKILGIEDTTTPPTGNNLDDYKKVCSEIFFRRYARQFEYMECKEYLKLKPKYISFATKQEPKTKPTRPPSKKATAKAKSDAELVSKAVLAVKGETNADRPIGGVQEGFFEQAGGFLAVASSALDGYIHSQQQKAILELLDTPEKKQFAREQMKLQISEMQAKRRKLAFEAVGTTTTTTTTTTPTALTTTAMATPTASEAIGTTTPTALTTAMATPTPLVGSTRNNPTYLSSGSDGADSDESE